MKPPRAVVVSVGDEILQGRITDTNSQTFADRLLQLGCDVRSMVTVGDSPGALQEQLERLRGQFEVVLSTGGLGPTADDRVRHEVAQVMGVPLVDAEPGAVDKLAAFYEKQHGRAAPDPYVAQGRVPAGSTALSNRAGTAWGFMADLGGGTRLYCLPGPPREADSAFSLGGAEADLVQRFAAADHLALATFHTACVPESEVEHRIHELMQRGGNPRVGILANADKVTVSVLAEDDGPRAARELAIEIGMQVVERLGDIVWGRDRDTLESVVLEKLVARHERVAVAESCTGGGLAARLTSIPGASRAFAHGWVTYSNEAKQSLLGVPAGLLAEHGAVSREVAEAMAAGARERSGADWAIALTGIAGPDGGTDEKPVGLVYLAVAGPDGVLVHRRRQYARAGREAVQRLSIRDALEALRRRMLGLQPIPDRK